MASLFSRLGGELAKTISNPSRILNIASMRQRQIFMGHLLTQLKVSNDWKTLKDAPGTTKRSYQTYQDYLDHQQSILSLIDLSDYDRQFRPALLDRLRKHEIVGPNRNVLCLAARVGTEVKAFRDAGCFAVGIDIDKREKNAWVLYGDFHNLEFPDLCVDIVYCNSLDHAFDIERLIKEIKRVLKADGTLMLEIAIGAKQGLAPGEYEAFWWDSIDDVVAFVEKLGFVTVGRETFDIPWPGEMVLFSGKCSAS